MRFYGFTMSEPGSKQSLGGATAVVTGAGRGIGRSIVDRLVEDGMNVVVVDRSFGLGDAIDDWRAKGAKVTIVETDLTTEEAPLYVEEAVKRTGSLRALVNNAGITRDARLEKMSEEDFLDVVEVNTGAAYRLTIGLLSLLEEGSAIVNMASRAFLGNFGQYNYSVSKGALVGLTRAMAWELAPGIRVNAIAPGLVGTEMAQSIPDDILEKMVSSIPLGRMGDPSEIAELVSFLISDRSSYITGQVIVAGGGRSLTPRGTR